MSNKKEKMEQVCRIDGTSIFYCLRKKNSNSLVFYRKSKIYSTIDYIRHMECGYDK